MRIGVYVYGIASVAAGVTDLVWGELEPSHQPLQAWGEHIPGMKIFGYLVAAWLIAGGAAMLCRRSLRFGAASLTILYGVFILFPLPRFYTAPHFLGYGVAVYVGVLGSVCQQIILFAAALIAWKTLAPPGSLSQRWALVARWTFGLCSIDFGLAHLTAIQTVVPMIPKWMPLGATFWAVLTGIAFMLAGLAIVSGVLDVLAAWLLGLMLLVFSALTLAPMIFASPHDHEAWGANTYNLTAVGSTWIIAEWLAIQRRLVRSQQGSHQTKPLLA